MNMKILCSLRLRLAFMTKHNLKKMIRLALYISISVQNWVGLQMHHQVTWTYVQVSSLGSVCRLQLGQAKICDRKHLGKCAWIWTIKPYWSMKYFKGSLNFSELNFLVNCKLTQRNCLFHRWIQSRLCIYLWTEDIYLLMRAFGVTSDLTIMVDYE